MRRTIGILLVLAGLVWTSVGFAQNATVSYSYDTCGNRTERTLGFKKAEDKGRSLATDDGEGWLAKAEDDFGGIHLSLYPNPTEGSFSLSFSEELPAPMQAELCTSGGTVIERRLVKNLTEQFDLAGKSAGIYVLRLTSGKETQTWKIIKKN